MNIQNIVDYYIVEEFNKIAQIKPSIFSGRKDTFGLDKLISGKSNVARTAFKRPAGVSAGVFGGSYNSTVQPPKAPKIS